MTDDLRNRLRHLSDRVPETPSSDAFDRLDRARHRRIRTRKFGVLAVAFLIATGGTLTALRAFDDDGRSRVAGDPSPTAAPWTPPEVLTVWPEHPMAGDTSEQIQEAVDRGEDSLAWRLDPRAVAERFGKVVLGWDDVELVPIASQSIVVDEVRVDHWQIRPGCGPQSTLDGSACDEGLLGIRLVQPMRRGRGGIWSVQEVSSDQLDIDLPPTEPLIGGADLRFDLVLPRHRSVHIGIVATNACDEVYDFQPGLSAGPAALVIPKPDVGEGCGDVATGYAFAYVQDDGTVPVGDPLLEAATIEWPYLTLVPVRIDPAGSEEQSRTSDVLSIRCLREGFATELDQRVVFAGTDGVALDVRGDDDTLQLAFDVQEAGPIGPFFLDELPSFVALEPGKHTVACVHEGDVIGDAESFTVVNGSP